MLNPSDFSGIFPWSSVFQKSEYETIAQNIMKILKRTGDTWRELSYDEYEKERLKDVGMSEMEKPIFEKIIGYFKSPDTAKLFSPAWDIKE